MASAGRHEIGHLESFLQELSRHEQRSSRASAEQASVRTQQRLLKEQLQQAQDEIASAHDSNAKLCETIGSLQQAKEDRESEIKHLKLELKASRDSQSTLMKKIHRLEDEARDMKRGYVKSLACRMKTATQLLSQLQSTNVYPCIQGEATIAR
ncbi:hypothetical protein PybrP1_005701 [[Pythium] brassicae (nom. inval.)]|nr:hypothetical protein PybrP1_005701 [[Pythium] brassicae (nom. inval.)]